MSYEIKLNDLKEKLDRAKNLKYQAEARLEQLRKQEEEIIKQLNDLGINPEELDTEIEHLEYRIEKLFNEANSNLPKEILGGD